MLPSQKGGYIGKCETKGVGEWFILSASVSNINKMRENETEKVR